MNTELINKVIQELREDFPGHVGVPGQRGGSAPRSEGEAGQVASQSTYKGGWDKMSKEEQNKALSKEIVNFTPLINFIVHKTPLAGYDKEDMKRELERGLWEAMKRYDPEKSGSFPAYTKMVLNSAKLDMISKSRTQIGHQKEIERVMKSVTKTIYPRRYGGEWRAEE